MAEIRDTFHGALDHYLEVSERTGHRPQKPYSDKIMLRVAPKQAAMQADAAGKSLNQWAAEALERSVNHP